MRIAAVAAVAALIAGCKPISDPGDLRTEARVVLQAVEESKGIPIALDDVSEISSDLPLTIRVWRRALDKSEDSCAGRVDEIGLEDYVAGVVPSEWMADWEPESLQAGAIAARTYASFWAAIGGKYQCADLDDTTWTQVYKDKRHPKTDAAVAATEAAVVTRGGHLVFAEYSAENGSPTEFGVRDDTCAGRRVNGHGRGVCQWGTQRWALRGETAEWMMSHYYPGARVRWPDEALTDGVDLTVRAGDTFELSLIVANIEPDPWPAGSVSVGTDPSAFADDTWKSPTRPAVVRSAIQQHEEATLTWQMTAPRVNEPTTYAEFFYLDGPATDRPGASGSWRITVVPSPPRGKPKKKETTWILPAAAAGGLTLLGAIFLFLHRRARE